MFQMAKMYLFRSPDETDPLSPSCKSRLPSSLAAGRASALPWRRTLGAKSGEWTITPLGMVVVKVDLPFSSFSTKPTKSIDLRNKESLERNSEVQLSPVLDVVLL